MTKKILVVEDDEEINNLLCDILVQNEYDAKSAFTGMDGISLIRNSKFDLIILDLMLPYKSGDEILRELRTFSSTPVIVISAKGLTQTKVELLRLGADDYITKPFDLEEVLARIETNIRRCSLQNSLKEKSTVLNYKDIEINTHISNLRNKLKKANKNEKYIETMWGLGYRLYRISC